MPAGAIALTNGSATVTGTGTSFTTEFKVGDFVGVVVGGVPYTLIVSAIASNTSLTIAAVFTGPTTSGLAWYAVPAILQTAITQQAMNDMSKVLRGMIQEKANWQQVYSGTGTITVKLPDGSTYSGPAWNGITSLINAKAASGANSDITSLNALTTALTVAQGGTGGKTKADAWSSLATYGNTAGTAAQGNDSRLNTIDGKSGGTITGSASLRTDGTTEQNRTGGVLASDIRVSGISRGNVNFYMSTSGATRVAKIDVYADGQNGKAFSFFQDSGSATCQGSWISSSDERHKSNIKLVEKPLVAVMSWRGCTFDKKDGDSEVGLIAQDVDKFCPTAVFHGGDRNFSDGTVIKDFLSLNVAGVSAAYHTEAIKALFSLVELAIVDPENALASIDAIKAELAKSS